ncbi:collagen binding domain-containing protein [Streptomyces sp. NPDC056244]|uniref:MSCRAMM family protein n=1 Tax=Streptomyces sp. NPDC056244 TaxID=3345762 RepID=UPI0035E1FBF8
MRTRSARRTSAAAITLAVTGTLAWAPAASAQSPVAAPSASAPALLDMPEAGGGVQILKKDSGGDLMSGAAFTLLDAAGTEAASGTTNAQGQLAFTDLPIGVYRLKETSSGSPLHDLAGDQDVIITPGTAAPLTIIDPFKPADLTVRKTDENSGRPLSGAVVNVTPAGGGDTVTLTTSKNGTATAQLPVSSRTGAAYTATETKAPSGYQLNAKPVKFTAKPGSSVTVTLANTKREQPTRPPTHPPTPTGATTPGSPSHESATPANPGTSKHATTPLPSSSGTGTPASVATAPSTEPPAPQGSLAHTGANATPWLLGTAALLLTAGGGTVVAARRHHTDDGQGEKPDES